MTVEGLVVVEVLTNVQRLTGLQIQGLRSGQLQLCGRADVLVVKEVAVGGPQQQIEIAVVVGVKPVRE